MLYNVEIDKKTASIEVTDHPDGGWWVSIEGAEARHITGGPAGQLDWRLHCSDESVRFALSQQKMVVHQVWKGRALLAKVYDPRALSFSDLKGGSQGEVSCEMPGSIVRVIGSAGDTVSEGQVVVVVEAMKMENEFRAPFDGVLAEVGVSVGEVVDSGVVLFKMQPEESS